MGEILLPKEDPPEGGLTKRTYAPPILCGYGTLRDITLHVGNKGSSDHHSKPPHKTHM
jgi:hypothetical protein